MSYSKAGRIYPGAKPPFGSIIDKTHPLAQGLVCDFSFLEGSGERVRDLQNDYIAALTRDSGTLIPQWYPPGLLFPASDNSFVLEGGTGIGDPSAISKIPYTDLIGAITIIFRGSVRIGSNFHHFAGHHLIHGPVDCPFDYRTSNDATPALFINRANASTNRAHTGPNLTIGLHSTIGVTIADGLCETVPIFYVNGSPTLGVAVGPATGAVTGDPLANLRIGRRADGVCQLDGICEYLRIWKRALTAEEMAWIHNDPYAYIAVPTYRRYISFGPPSIIASDTLNNWQDASLVAEPRSTAASDTLNAWNDAVTLDYLAPATPQTININDRIDKQKGNSANSTFPSWVDGVNLVLLPDGPLQIGTNDLSSFSDDFAALGLGLIFTDSINNLSDSAANTPGLAREAFDSMFFNIADAAQVQLIANVATISVADTLNAWADAALTDNASNPIPPLFDGLILNDSNTLRLNHLLATPDTLVLTDVVNLALGVGYSVADSNASNWNDDVVVAMVIARSASATDTMTMSDAANTLLNTSLTNYLRRYLNDVVN